MGTLTAVQVAKTTHTVHQGDARHLDWVPDESVHLVVTSPAYWTLKEYPAHKAQLGSVAEYAKHPEIFPGARGTPFSFARLVVYSDAPALRVFFTYDATEVRLICVEFAE